MKPDYKNWMPKGMIASFAAGTIASLAAALAVQVRTPAGKGKRVLTAI